MTAETPKTTDLTALLNEAQGLLIEAQDALVGRDDVCMDVDGNDAIAIWREKVRLALANRDPQAGEWRPIETAPKDGTLFDVWCVNPKAPEGRGVRFTDVHMRGDRSGFGYCHFFRDQMEWQYLDARDEGAGFPAWLPTHWMPLPASPQDDRMGGSRIIDGLKDTAEGRYTVREVERPASCPECGVPPLALHKPDCPRLANTNEGEGA